MSDLDDLKMFHVSNAMLNAELRSIEAKFSIDLGQEPEQEVKQDPDFYPQLPAAIRAEAAWMSKHYEVFYVLENSIRELVVSKMEDKYGDTWWDHVSPAVKENVEKNRTREREAGVTMRSADHIDYTTFGELSQIIQDNWDDVFSDTFNNKKAAAKVLSGLNMLRGPIAHCSPLAADEVKRLDLSIRDYFRLME